MTEKQLNTLNSGNQLINVSEVIIDCETVNSVDARDLHLFLESGQNFADWIKNRIEKYEFIEGIDFITNHNSMFSPPRKEYTISMDMAKELSMVERNSKGKQARQYFIKCEKIAKQVKKPTHASEIVQCQLLGAETISRMLNYSETSKVDIVKRVYEINNVDSAFLPVYIENVKIVLSATELLKRNECELKVRAFNFLLIDQGYLEEKTRPSSGGKTKTFKALTEKGLAYGQNDASPQNKLEIQPHYFEDSFMDLYRIITGE